MKQTWPSSIYWKIFWGCLNKNVYHNTPTIMSLHTFPASNHTFGCVYPEDTDCSTSSNVCDHQSKYTCWNLAALVLLDCIFSIICLLGSSCSGLSSHNGFLMIHVPREYAIFYWSVNLLEPLNWLPECGVTTCTESWVTVWCDSSIEEVVTLE